MNIGFDFDGVFSDCGDLKSQGARKLYGLDIPSEKFKTEIVVGEGILTREQYKYLQKQIYETEEIGMRMKPVEGVLHFVPKLQEQHNISIVTSRGGVSIEIARNWLQKFSLDIILLGTGGESNVNSCRGMDVYVDDDIDKLEPLVNIVPNRFLFSWGYNKHINVSPSVARRVSSWEDLYQRITSLDNNLFSE